MHLNHLHMHLSCRTRWSGPRTAGVGEAEEVYQEEQQQQYVGEDQEQALEQDLTNFVDTQGKPRCMLNPLPFTIES